MVRLPVCLNCGVEMYPFENGINLMYLSDGKPYQIWRADEYRCPMCNARIAAGFGIHPVAEDWQSVFDEYEIHYTIGEKNDHRNSTH